MHNSVHAYSQASRAEEQAGHIRMSFSGLTVPSTCYGDGDVQDQCEQQEEHARERRPVKLAPREAQEHPDGWGASTDAVGDCKAVKTYQHIP